jgi:hypothetical protein
MFVKPYINPLAVKGNPVEIQRKKKRPAGELELSRGPRHRLPALEEGKQMTKVKVTTGAAAPSMSNRPDARERGGGPTINYEVVIQARAAQIDARTNIKTLAPAFRTQKHQELLHTQHVESQREKFRGWEMLGNHYADVLEDPNTPADVHNVIACEMDDLASRAGLNITSPEVLRLLYPWLRDRLYEKEVS